MDFSPEDAIMIAPVFVEVRLAVVGLLPIGAWSAW